MTEENDRRKKSRVISVSVTFYWNTVPAIPLMYGPWLFGGYNRDSDRDPGPTKLKIFGALSEKVCQPDSGSCSIYSMASPAFACSLGWRRAMGLRWTAWWHGAYKELQEVPQEQGLTACPHPLGKQWMGARENCALFEDPWITQRAPSEVDWWAPGVNALSYYLMDVHH